MSFKELQFWLHENFDGIALCHRGLEQEYRCGSEKLWKKIFWKNKVWRFVTFWVLVKICCTIFLSRITSQSFSYQINGLKTDDNFILVSSYFLKKCYVPNGSGFLKTWFMTYQQNNRSKFVSKLKLFDN